MLKSLFDIQKRHLDFLHILFLETGFEPFSRIWLKEVLHEKCYDREKESRRFVLKPGLSSGLISNEYCLLPAKETGLVKQVRKGQDRRTPALFQFQKNKVPKEWVVELEAKISAQETRCSCVCARCASLEEKLLQLQRDLEKALAIVREIIGG